MGGERGRLGMKVSVRSLEGSPELARGVDKLRTLVYPEYPEAYDVDWHASIWRWLESHPLADRMQRWVLATEGDWVVGHLAAVPQYYRVNGRRVVAHTPADYQVLPGYGFHAISMMRRFFRTAENCVAVDQVQESMAIETSLGAREVGMLRYDAKLLDPSAVPRVPAVVRPLLRLPGRGLRALDGALWRLFGGGHQVEVLGGFDPTFDGLFESVAAALPCVPEKDAAFLRWRYGPGSPQFPVTLLGVKCGDALLGYAVLRVPREGGDGYLLDLTVRPGRRDIARSLVMEALVHFALAGAYIVRYHFMESAASPRAEDLRRFGFFSREKRRLTLLVRFLDRTAHETALQPANWAYSGGDGEMTFWVR